MTAAKHPFLREGRCSGLYTTSVSEPELCPFIAPCLKSCWSCCMNCPCPVSSCSSLIVVACLVCLFPSIAPDSRNRPRHRNPCVSNHDACIAGLSRRCPKLKENRAAQDALPIWVNRVEPTSNSSLLKYRLVMSPCSQ